MGGTGKGRPRKTFIMRWRYLAVLARAGRWKLCRHRSPGPPTAEIGDCPLFASRIQIQGRHPNQTVSHRKFNSPRMTASGIAMNKAIPVRIRSEGVARDVRLYAVIPQSVARNSSNQPRAEPPNSSRSGRGGERKMRGPKATTTPIIANVRLAFVSRGRGCTATNEGAIFSPHSGHLPSEARPRKL